ncbi:hypothetical protein M5689_009305 [Euphorbia peplus]|nr:hypothetical protein M5689_009305 [Euphorbia peplus]
MGHGSNAFGGSSSPSPSSNLSALAPPFTVDRSIPKFGSNPLVDLSETSTYGLTFNHPLHNWLAPQSPLESDSNGYRYSSSVDHVAPPLNNPLVPDTDLYGQSSNNLLEAKPYYPSYVSKAIANCSPLDMPGYDMLSTSQVPTTNNSVHEDYTQSLSGLDRSTHWSGLWEGLPDWQQARPSPLDGSFYSKDNYFNQGLYASEGIAKFEEASHSIDAAVIEKENESGFRGQRDYYSSLLGEIPKFVSSTSSASPLPVPGACPPVEPLRPVNSWSHQIQYGASFENCLRKHDATPSDISLGMNSSPAIYDEPLAQETSLFRKIKATSSGDNKAFPSNSSCFVMEPHPFLSSNPNISSNGDYRVPSSNNLSVSLEPDPSMSSKGSVYCDASQASFLHEQNEQAISGFSLAKNKEISRSETLPMDSLDQVYGKRYRIQVPHASPDSSSIAGDKNEGINSVKNYSENIDHYNPAVDSPCWRGAPVSHFSQFEFAEAFSPQGVKKIGTCGGPNLQVHPVSNLSGNGAENISPEKTSKNLMRHESWSGVSCLAPLNTPKGDTVLLREGTGDAAKAGSCYTKPICSTGVNVVDDSLSKKLFYNPDSKLLYKEQQSCEGDKWINEKRCGEEINFTNVGMNVNDPDDFSSQVPFHAIEHVLCSPPSTDYAQSKFIESNGGESSTQKMYVKTLIDTMQNLSELLVFHLSNDACELKKDDYEALKDVIHNLDLCMYKTVERSERVTSQVLGNSSTHQKDPSGNESQASGIHLPNGVAPVKYHLVQEEEDDSSVFGKDEKLSNFVSSVSATDILKDNSTIQALKKALIENFDAEEEETDPQVLLYKNLWLEAEASLCSASCIARFNRIKNEMENHNSQTTNGNTVVMEKLSRSEVPFNQDAADTLASDTKGCHVPEEDDVAARFNILKCRIDNSNTDNTSHQEILGCAEKRCTSDDCPTEIVEKLGFEGKAVHEKSEMSIQHDFEDSVMSRFSILKRRDDNLSSMDREEEEDQAASVDSGGYAGGSPSCQNKPEDSVSDVNKEAQLNSHQFDSTEGKLGVEEFDQVVEDDQVMKSGMVSKAGDQTRGASGDGSSSDWEHVLLEELGGLSS